MQIPFVGGGVNSRRAISSDSEYCLNFYPEITKQGSKSQMRLIGTPGLELLTAVEDNEYNCRGFYVSAAGNFYAVIGNNFYQVFASGVTTLLGTFTGSVATTPVYFSENVNLTNNTTQIMIVDNAGGYIFKTSDSSFTRITDSNYSAGTRVIYKDGLFIQNKRGTNQFMFSNLYDGLTWSALDYYAAEGNSDTIYTIETINNDIWLFGNKSIEAYYPTGVSSSPFAKTPNSYSDIGISGQWSLAKINNTLFWIGQGREGHNQVYMLSDYTPIKISDSNIEYFLNNITGINSSVGFCYQQEGHLFYMLTFPDDDKTICYDATTGIWHERGYYNGSEGNNNIHRAYCTEYFNNKVVAGDYNNSNIYYMDLDVYDDNGNEIQRIRQTNPFSQSGKRVFYNNFEVDLDAGQGLYTGQGSDPQVIMQFSNDNGNTWSDEYYTSAGKIGEYKNRVRYNRLGQARNRVFKIKVSDPIKWVINGAYSDIVTEA